MKQFYESLSQLEMDEETQKVFKYQLKTLDYGITAHHSGKEWFKKLFDEVKN